MLVLKSPDLAMSAAQDEVDALFANQVEKFDRHPEDIAQSPSDRSEQSSDVENSPQSENGEKSHPTISASATGDWHLPTSRTLDANTGPKGVIADARSFERARKLSVRQNIRTDSSNGVSSPQPFTKTKIENPDFGREESGSPEESRPEDDDGFMRSWRQHRINELQDPRVRRTSPSQRTYGSLEPVDAVGYLDAIEKVSADTVVVVCIYDDRVRRAYLVTPGLRPLAPSRRRGQHVDDRGTHSQASVASSKIV